METVVGTEEEIIKDWCIVRKGTCAGQHSYLID